MIKPEKWKLIEKEMGSIFGNVELQCDEYKISLAYGQDKKPTKYTLVLYVNGYLKGEWFCRFGKEDEPLEAKKFYPIKSTYAYKSAARTEFNKMSKKEQKMSLKYGFDPYKKIQYRGMYWGSLRSLRKHLEQNNKEISILRIGSKDYVNEEQS